MGSGRRSSILSDFLDTSPRARLRAGLSAPAASGVEARSARAAQRRGSPRAVTTGGKSGTAAIVDWLNLTFEHDRDVVEVLAELQLQLGRYVGAESMGGGKHGFEHGVRLHAYANGQLVPFGMFCWGGESQRGRALLSIEGGGCRLVQDWNAMHDWIAELPGVRLTRVDLAVDLHEGEYTVDDAKTWALEGRFNNGGRNPRLDVQGDWFTQEHGRTLYVGQASNGKMLRVYEKGKQLGDLDSIWNRFEVQFGNRDRELPLAMLVDRDKYFAAAYPALEEILGIVGEKIKTVRETTRITVQQAVQSMQRSYGKWVHLLADAGVQSADLVEAVRVRAVPTRLNLASVADAGLSATVHAVIMERRAA